ncbi:MAG: hypothetical protein K8R99_12385 [Actinomycetia bacterium]|nr:hypothetical protein [Actinomycetes bacterium]
MSKSRITLAALALAWPLAACGSEGGSTTATAPAATPAPATAPAPLATSDAGNASAPAALQFSAPAVGGGAIDFTQFAGKPVVLWFWAPT